MDIWRCFPYQPGFVARTQADIQADAFEIWRIKTLKLQLHILEAASKHPPAGVVFETVLGLLKVAGANSHPWFSPRFRRVQVEKFLVETVTGRSAPREVSPLSQLSRCSRATGTRCTGGVSWFFKKTYGNRLCCDLMYFLNSGAPPMQHNPSFRWGPWVDRYK